METAKVLELIYEAFHADIASDDFKLFGVQEILYDESQALAIIQERKTGARFKFTLTRMT